MIVESSVEYKARANLKFKKYQSWLALADQDSEKFWAEQAERISWYKPWHTTKQVSFESPVNIRWFDGGELNACYNCVDRHVEAAPLNSKVAMIFEPDSPDLPSRKITYAELYSEVNLLARVLLDHGVQRGDRVTIYMPMIPEAVYAMLACARIGAIHSVVFGGFAPDSICDRILDGESSFVITADEGVRGGKNIPLKKNVDLALEKLKSQLKAAKGTASKSAKETTEETAEESGGSSEFAGVQKVFVFPYQGKNSDITWHPEQDVNWQEAVNHLRNKNLEEVYVKPESMNAEDPLFLLYTSGSTNKPKGVLHTTGGYMVYSNFTFSEVFDYRDEDVFWCTADVGWITGHSYIVYGPLSRGATMVIFEGVPSYPDVSRFWEVIDKHQVSIFYTAPTALRALMCHGERPVWSTSRKSLRLLGTVGEPINPEAWQWYHKVVGEERCPIVDTWWQTETGGILISPLPAVNAMKPGSASVPLPGIKACILNPQTGEELSGACQGVLALKDSWPGQMRTVYGSHARFEETYFSQYPGYYFTGDGCRRDEDGFYWITGRVDDVLNISGHRIGTAEVESAFVAHETVAEAAVVPRPHEIKGQGIYAFVTLKNGVVASQELKKKLIEQVRHEIGGIASPDWIQFAPGLPKTRSGKIMRRILRKIAEGQVDSLGDTSTLADPSVVEDLKRHRIS